MNYDFENFNKKIGVLGLGYVGLPLAIEFSKKYVTIGFDKDSSRIQELKSGYDNTNELKKSELKKSNITLSSNVNDLLECNIFIITVPTPVNENNAPDLNPLRSASKMIGKIIKKGAFVIYESTVYPGLTEEFCVPLIERESGLKLNLDFSCGYSPERINPGDKKHDLLNIVKVTSGSNSASADFIDKLYKSIIPAGTFKASSIQVAESAKVIENVQRDVNIALINELSMIFDKLNLDTTEILDAASSKWNFIPFRPGLVGGHCIGVDPYYLTYKAEEAGYDPKMILAGRKINDGMGSFVVEKTIFLMKKLQIKVDKASVLVMGLTFKEDCPDLRNTKVTSIISGLESYSCEIKVVDPNADSNEVIDKLNIILSEFELKGDIDVVILAVAHKEYQDIKLDEWEDLFSGKGLLIDVKSIYPKDYFNKSKITHWRL